MACKRNPVTCEWETTAVYHPNEKNDTNEHHSLSYDIWLVNGVPRLQWFNQFEHQFSFEDQNTVEIYLFFLFLYILLVIIIKVSYF